MSFRFHFIITFIVLETLFLLGIVALNFNSLERESHQLIQDKTEIASSLFSEVVKTALLVNDLATIDDAAKQFVGMENIVSVQLYNADGELLSSAYNQNPRYQEKPVNNILLNGINAIPDDENGIRYINDYAFLTLDSTVKVDDTLIGATYFIYDVTRSMQALSTNAFYTYLLAGTEIFISSLVSLWIGFRIANAIERLSLVANEIAHDRTIEIPEYKKNGDEIDKLYQSVRNMQNMIIERKDKLEQEKDKANKANKAKSDFLAVMSHEIRTPLNGITGSLDLIDLKKLDPDDTKQVQLAQTSSELLLTTINDILDFSKIEAGKFSLHNAPFSMKRLLSETEQIYRPLIEGRGLYFKLQQQSIEQLYLIGDQIRIKQILGNYLNNALKFTDEGGITLCAQYSVEEGLALLVQDTGIGIKDEDIANLFSHFTQVDNGANRRYGGTGLGLAIAKSLAGLMEGNVYVSSQYGKGSIFGASLKLETTTENEYVKTLPNLPEQDAINNDETKHFRILLVEDNIVNQKVAQRILEKKGHHVEIAVNGVEALQYFAQDHAFDLVLMDCQMPVMDGLTASRKIRAIDQDIPIIALTANTQDSDKEACYQAGMNDFVSKPFKPQKLYDVIAQHVGEYCLVV